MYPTLMKFDQSGERSPWEGCIMCAIVSEVPFMYRIVAVVMAEVLGLLSFW